MSIGKYEILTPEQGCGYTKVAQTRIVGGSQAKNGIKNYNLLWNYLWFRKSLRGNYGQF